MDPNRLSAIAKVTNLGVGRAVYSACIVADDDGYWLLCFSRSDSSPENSPWSAVAARRAPEELRRHPNLRGRACRLPNYLETIDIYNRHIAREAAMAK
jgi:hypothetical protein